MPASASTALTAGDLAVYQVGTGSGSLSSAATAVFIDEYTSTGAQSAQIGLPTADSGSTHALTSSGSAGSEGLVTLSGDGSTLLLTGYDVAPGSSKVSSSQTSSVLRTVGAINAAGAVNTSTTVNDFSGANIRGIASQNGTSVWVSGASGGVGYVASPGADVTPITIDASETDTRQVAVYDDQLYVSADPTSSSNSPKISVAAVGSGLPTGTASITNLPGISTSALPGEPYAFSFTTVGPGSGPNTLYVADSSSNSIDKFCIPQGASTWQSEGSAALPTESGATATVDGVTANDANGNAVSIYLTADTSSNGYLLSLPDSSGLCGALTGAPTTIATSAANENFRGVAFTPGTAIGSGGDTQPPTITSSAVGLPAAIGDRTNPTFPFTVADSFYNPSQISVTASSSNAAVAANSGLSITGTGTSRTLSVTPGATVGTATITLTATAPDGMTSSYPITYGLSANLGDSSQRYYAGAGNGSTEIDVGGGYMIVGDDESNVLRLYNEAASGPPVATYDFTNYIGTKEIDIESSARVGNTLYWTGSMSNDSSGKQEPTRSTLFAATINGSGANTTLTYLGDYTNLQSDLVSWDTDNGSGLGANYLGFAAASAAGMTDHASNAFNVEGMEFAPGSSTTAYLAFRAPLEPYGNGASTEGNEALLVPVTNLNRLITPPGGSPTTAATFGAPIFWNLGTDASTNLGLGVREIRDNPGCQTGASACNYLVIAGSVDGSNDDFQLYNWDGVPSDPPLLTGTQLPIEPAAPNQGAWEGIVSVPDQLITGDPVELVQDDGDVDWYNIGETSKTGLLMDLQKDLGQTFAYEGPTSTGPAPTIPAAPTSVTATTGVGTATVAWTAGSTGGSPLTSYTVTPYIGATAQAATTVTGTPPPTTATIGGLSTATAYTFTVTASNAVGTGPPSVASNPVTPTAPAAVTFVQQVSTHGHGASLTVTPSAALGAGHRLVVEVAAWSAANVTTSAVTDSAGDAFTEVTHFVAGDGTEQSVWTAPVSAGAGLKPSITAKFTGSADGAVGLLEYAGLSTAAGSGAVDVQAHASGTTAAAATVSSGVTGAAGAANELAIGFYSDSGFGDSLTAGSGYTARTNISGTSDMEILAEDQTVSAGVAAAATAGTGAKTMWEMTTVVFKTAAPVAPVVPTVPAAPAAPSAVAANGSAVVAWTAPANGGSSITAYTVTPYLGPVAQTATTIIGNPPATTATMGGLTNGSVYTFTVTATNAVGTGSASVASNPVIPTTVTAPVFVQQVSAHTPSKASLSVTTSNTVTTGDRLIVEIGVWSAGDAKAAGVTDSAGDTFTELSSVITSDGTELSVWTAPITTGGSKPTITAKASATADMGVAVLEYAGLSPASGTAVVDQSVSATGTTTTARTVTSGPTKAATAANELAVGFYADSGFSDTLIAGAGSTSRVDVSPTGDIELFAEDSVVTQGATPASSVGTGAGTPWDMTTVVFKT